MGHSTKGVRIKGQIKDRTRLSFTVSLIKYTGCTAQCGAPVTSVTSRRSSPTNRLTGSHWALSNTPTFPSLVPWRLRLAVAVSQIELVTGFFIRESLYLDRDRRQKIWMGRRRYNNTIIDI